MWLMVLILSVRFHFEHFSDLFHQFGYNFRPILYVRNMSKDVILILGIYFFKFYLKIRITKLYYKLYILTGVKAAAIKSKLSNAFSGLSLKSRLTRSKPGSRETSEPPSPASPELPNLPELHQDEMGYPLAIFTKVISPINIRLNFRWGSLWYINALLYHKILLKVETRAKFHNNGFTFSVNPNNC